MRFELACACINHLECRLELIFRLFAGDPCKSLVCKTELFGLYIFIECEFFAGDILLELNEIPDLGQEPHVDLCLLIDELDVNASSYRFRNIEESFVGSLDAVRHEVFVGYFLHLLEVKRISGDLRTSDCLHESALE